MTLKIYVAAPITGKTPQEVLDYFTNIRDILTRLGYEVFQPMTAKGFFRTQEGEFTSSGYSNPVSTDHAIYERDMFMVDNSDIVFLNFENTTKASIGMVCELTRASAKGKHTVCVIPPDNVHNHAFIKQAADIVFEGSMQALEYLGTFAKQEC